MPMNLETRVLLDKIDNLLMSAPYHVRQDVVRALRAMRGPDLPDDELKNKTTARIRFAAFPLSGPEFGATSSGLISEDDIERATELSNHFGIAINRAAFGLGLLRP